MDLSVYLVTDSTPAILGNRDLCEVVRDAVQGGKSAPAVEWSLLPFFKSMILICSCWLGVTVVQYRDKHSDTGVMIETAKKLHEITKKYNVPLIINDRVDVALAIGAEGVHLGQDDMS